LAFAAQEFPAKESILNNTPALIRRPKPLLKAPIISSRNIEKFGYSACTPTSIWQTRYSEFWQWQRVSEWYDEYGQDEIINKRGT
jgi:hypothetical protein